MTRQGSVTLLAQRSSRMSALSRHQLFTCRRRSARSLPTVVYCLPANESTDRIVVDPWPLSSSHWCYYWEASSPTRVLGLPSQLAEQRRSACWTPARDRDMDTVRRTGRHQAGRRATRLLLRSPPPRLVSRRGCRGQQTVCIHNSELADLIATFVDW